jgi:hypothetical protein
MRINGINICNTAQNNAAFDYIKKNDLISVGH